MLGRLVFAAAAALVGTVSAQLTVTNPSASSWWVAQSTNTMAWTCNSSPYTNFTILLANSNPSILVQPIAIIAIEQNYDCSKTITQQQSSQPASTGYTIQLANPLNNTDVYATSQPFEIKALGSAYPATDSASASGSSATGTGSASPSSSTGKSGGALAQYIPAGVGMAIALVMGTVVA